MHFDWDYIIRYCHIKIQKWGSLSEAYAVLAHAFIDNSIFHLAKTTTDNIN